MTDSTLIYTILAILSVSVAINLKLTFRILQLMRNPPPQDTALAFAPGDAVPEIRGKRLADAQAMSLDHSGRASVLLFLSSRCPKCREKLPEIAALVPRLGPAGLDLWLLTTERKGRLEEFLGDGPLMALALKVSGRAYKQLNPALASPFYLFLDHQGQLQAGGMIGDADWQSFIEQMAEFGDELESVA
ncbi:hypothetical protein [Gallaecimonas sp. GXIMD4217]|uniref:TlpA family protein disulfide reductase n=1 Tax=Gallaecimonas sp. GXIMD4217 TaxID=3131927 RepID=UPI00311B07BA